TDVMLAEISAGLALGTVEGLVAARRAANALLAEIRARSRPRRSIRATKPCGYCGKVFALPAGLLGKRKYCSVSCGARGPTAAVVGPRSAEALTRLAGGESMASIARALGISVTTVTHYRNDAARRELFRKYQNQPKPEA
ncbi:MAG: LuxR C-terminal-related transcriptional regulator, partial [Xanthobacteraceae bacterium]|nr:LuxR C-terminal-related transcriptional regulator [Xanthobacteraceae bacterium]